MVTVSSLLIKIKRRKRLGKSYKNRTGTTHGAIIYALNIKVKK